MADVYHMQPSVLIMVAFKSLWPALHSDWTFSPLDGLNMESYLDVPSHAEVVHILILLDAMLQWFYTNLTCLMLQWCNNQVTNGEA